MKRKNFVTATIAALVIAFTLGTATSIRADDRSCDGLYSNDVLNATNEYYTCLTTAGMYFQFGCSTMYGIKLSIATTVYAACKAVDAAMR